jgi:hypothetical protein
LRKEEKDRETLHTGTSRHNGFALSANAQTILLGDRDVESQVDSNEVGQAEAFPAAATSGSGTVTLPDLALSKHQ